jgi:hypothetical protein
VGNALIITEDAETIASGDRVLFQEGEFVDEEPKDNPKKYCQFAHIYRQIICSTFKQ